MGGIVARAGRAWLSGRRVGLLWECEQAAGACAQFVNLVSDGDSHRRAEAFGFADKARGIPAATDTIFQLASMTKPMVAVGSLALTEQSRLPLQSKLSDYFPGFGTMQVGVQSADGKLTTEPQKRPIFIHDLFRHTSGLTYGGRPDGGSPLAAQWPSGSAASHMGKASEMAEALT